MTFLYTRTNTWSSAPQPTEDTIKAWKHISQKKNWRIVQLPNGFLQTEYRDVDDPEILTDVTRRETIGGAEQAIDSSIEHYAKKLEFTNGPKVIKTFE